MSPLYTSTNRSTGQNAAMSGTRQLDGTTPHVTAKPMTRPRFRCLNKFSSLLPWRRKPHGLIRDPSAHVLLQGWVRNAMPRGADLRDPVLKPGYLSGVMDH